jgi:hypothetical protein
MISKFQTNVLSLPSNHQHGLQPGNLCLCLIRQMLPALVAASRGKYSGDALAVDSKEQCGIARPEMGKVCLARELPVYMRDRRKPFRFILRRARGNP